MIVIARTDGPSLINGVESHGLKTGKEYDVISWSYHDGNSWVEKFGNLINPKEPRFFIKVKNEYDIISDYWNDYFYQLSRCVKYN